MKMGFDFNPSDDKVSWSKRVVVNHEQVSVRIIQYKHYEPKLQILKHKLDDMNEPAGYNTNRYKLDQVDELISLINEAKTELIKTKKEYGEYGQYVYSDKDKALVNNMIRSVKFDPSRYE